MNQIVKKGWQIFCDAGSNHNGDLDRAKKIIKAVAKLNGVVGGDHFAGVKFQLFSAETLWAYDSDYAPAKEDVRLRETPMEWVPELIAAGRKHGIDIGFTAFDADMLTELGDYAPSIFFKVSSFDLLRRDYLQRVAQKAEASDRPLHISTGGATMREVQDALDAVCVVAPGLPIYLYHCVSSYPTRPEDAKMYDLSRLDVLVRKYHNNRITLGWSDHSHNAGVICRALSVYADVIELHVDLEDGLGAESRHGHCWRPSELMDLASIVKGFHDANTCNEEKWNAPDLRADPEDGKRPLFAFRHKKGPSFQERRKQQEDEMWKKVKNFEK